MGAFDWSFVQSIIPEMLSGLLTTLEITVIVIVLSMILAVPLAVARMTKIEVIRWVAQGYSRFSVAPRCWSSCSGSSTRCRCCSVSLSPDSCPR